MELSLFSWVLIGLSGLIVGLSKSGVPGLGVLMVPLMATAVEPRASVGLLLPMLMVGDLFALYFYTKHTAWKKLLPLIPWGFIGLGLGYAGLRYFDGATENGFDLGNFIGIVTIVMLGFMVYNDWRMKSSDGDGKIEGKKLLILAAIVGTGAGITTMMANAGGPVLILYLLAIRLTKEEFVGTAAWFFAIFNIIKVPFYIHEEMITWESLEVNLKIIWVVPLGSFLGVMILKKIPQDLFKNLVIGFTAVTGLHLIFPDFLTGLLQNDS